MGNHLRTRLVLVVSFTIVVVVLGLSFKPRYQLWAYMQPYNRLVNSHATESEIIGKEGIPNKVVTSEEELSRFMDSHRPFRAVNTHVESKVLVYWADPLHDAEGYAVYIFLDRKGRAVDAVMGGG